MRINTNVNALVAYKNLNGINSAVSDSMSKLSTGFRINRAADDAAGLGIANKLRAETRALGQASRNAEQANSVLQIAEGATSSVQKALERMKELATQAGSDSVDAEGRTRISSEFDALRAEITRTVETTKFQGNSLLDGTFGDVGPQLLAADLGVATAGAGMYELSVDATAKTITLTRDGGAFDMIDLDTATAAEVSYTNGKAQLTFVSGGQTVTVKADASSASDITSMVDDLDGRSFVAEAGTAGTAAANGGVAESAGNVGTATNTYLGFEDFLLDAAKIGTDGAKDGEYTFQVDTTDGDPNTAAAQVGTTITLLRNGTAVAKALIGTDGIAADTTLTFKNIAADGTIPDATAAGDYGVSFAIDFDAGIDTEAEIKTYLESSTAGFNIATTGITAASLDSTHGVDGVDGNGTTQTARFLVGASGAYKTDDVIQLGSLDLTVETLGIDQASLATAEGARNALTSIDSAMSTLNETLGSIGANQNRLENTMSNLKTTILNFTAAESVVRDLDMAEEMMKFSKNNILAQAATSMLAQANASSQGILQLLRG